MKILIVRFSALGDVAMLVPIVKALAEQYPSMGIGVLSSHKMAGLFHSMPKNVKFIAANTRNEHAKAKGLKQLLRDVNYTQFDMLADMHDVWRSRVVRWMFRRKGKPIAKIEKSRWDKWKLVHLHQVDKPLTSTHERYLKVLQDLGLSLTFPPTPTEDSSSRFGIGIAPFAAHETKVYPLERMEKVVEHFSQTGEPIYLFGGGHTERKILQAWADRYPNVQNVAGAFTLSQELALMQKLRVMISMDSSNMHLASLTGTRVVSIWGATHPAAGFLGFGQKIQDCVQRDLRCRPCSVYGDKPCRMRHRYCLNISPEEIIRRAQA